MWETFLLQMNDFDRFLEIKLQRMLDPVVAQRPPVRRGRKTIVLAFETPRIEAGADATSVVEPAVMTIPVTPTL